MHFIAAGYTVTEEVMRDFMGGVSCLNVRAPPLAGGEGKRRRVAEAAIYYECLPGVV